MAQYVVTLRRTSSISASVGSLNCPGSGMRRFAINDLELGSEDSPGGNDFIFTLQRIITAGTSTAVTPTPVDPADAAAVTMAGQNHTVEPTYSAGQVLLDVEVYQRNTARWVAKDDSALLVPATANNGIGIKTPSPSAAGILVTTTVAFTEL